MIAWLRRLWRRDDEIECGARALVLVRATWVEHYCTRMPHKGDHFYELVRSDEGRALAGMRGSDD